MSVGVSKSGSDLNVNAPVEEFMLNFEASAPPFKDQVTFSSAEKVWTNFKFSSIDLELDEDPEPPLGPLIFGEISSTSFTLTVRI